MPVWAVGILIGVAVGHPYYLGFVTFPIALLAAFFFSLAKLEARHTHPSKAKSVPVHQY